MKKLLVLLLVGVILLSAFAVTPGALAYIEIPDPVTIVFDAGSCAYIEIPDPVTHVVGAGP